MIALGVVATHAVACYVAIDIAWTQYIHKHIEKSPRKLFYMYALRTSVVFLTCKLNSLNLFYDSHFISIHSNLFIDSYHGSGNSKLGCIHIIGWCIGTINTRYYVSGAVRNSGQMEESSWSCKSIHGLQKCIYCIDWYCRFLCWHIT